jgi:hypothetical protein
MPRLPLWNKQIAPLSQSIHKLAIGIAKTKLIEVTPEPITNATYTLHFKVLLTSALGTLVKDTKGSKFALKLSSF